MKDIQEDLEQSKSFMRANYRRLEPLFEDVDLTYNEQRKLLWLSGYDSDTIDTFIALFKKLKR
ncbi:MAG TPA: hypothetical protein H9829_04085 [Candidatus Tetragenococcus pullicola]|nr:hypothetical protein [Candidatus Tetragenococcus pullicola]